jgi:hypothetical protein
VVAFIIKIHFFTEIEPTPRVRMSISIQAPIHNFNARALIKFYNRVFMFGYRILDHDKVSNTIVAVFSWLNPK